MYERFTDRARKVLQMAYQAAERRKTAYIDTEDILNGLIEVSKGLAAQIFENLGVDLGEIRQEIEKLNQSGPEIDTGDRLPYTPRGKYVINYSMEEARSLSHNYVGTEHILLGLLRENEGVAGRILRRRGLTVEVVRKEILQVLDSTDHVEES